MRWLGEPQGEPGRSRVRMADGSLAPASRVRPAGHDKTRSAKVTQVTPATLPCPPEFTPVPQILEPSRVTHCTPEEFTRPQSVANSGATPRWAWVRNLRPRPAGAMMADNAKERATWQSRVDCARLHRCRTVGWGKLGGVGGCIWHSAPEFPGELPMRMGLICLGLLISTACQSESVVGEPVTQGAEIKGSSFLEPRNINRETFVLINLPKGVSVQIPNNWIELSANSRTTVAAASEAMANDLEDYAPSDLAFAANLYDDAGKTIALFNIRYYPEMDVLQSELASAGREDLVHIENSILKNLQRGAEVAGYKILSWENMKRVEINGMIALVTDYRREFPGRPVFKVRLVRVINGPSSFTVTVSYREDQEVLLKPITNYIISTLQTNLNAH